MSSYVFELTLGLYTFISFTALTQPSSSQRFYVLSYDQVDHSTVINLESEQFPVEQMIA